jgi:hypothetical protein
MFTDPVLWLLAVAISRHRSPSTGQVTKSKYKQDANNAMITATLGQAHQQQDKHLPAIDVLCAQ